MAHHRKPLERRTYSQDRYYALIKRQKSGKATFKELTELDEIVNRVPDIRELVIRESFMVDDNPDGPVPPNNSGKENKSDLPPMQHLTFWDRIRSFVTRAFTTQITIIIPVT
jgi:hypothetical protein